MLTTGMGIMDMDTGMGTMVMDTTVMPAAIMEDMFMVDMDIIMVTDTAMVIMDIMGDIMDTTDTCE